MLFSSKRNSIGKLRLKKPTIFCLPGFHVDPVWRRTQAEYIEHSLSLMRQYLLACQADPYYGVYLSEIDYLKPYLDLYPEERAWLIKLIKQERCATGGAYNQPNETSIGGEALIRNLLIGRVYHQTILDDESPVFMNWDAFGHAPQTPQILAQCGIQATILTRTNYRDQTIKIPGVPDLFLWQAPDGSSVYVRRLDYSMPRETPLEVESARRFDTQKYDFPNIIADFTMDAGDMISPRAEILRRCRELADDEPSIVITGAAARKYFAAIDTLRTGRKLILESVTRDLSQYNEGCELTRADLKIANRLVENRLYEAETWSTVAAGYNIPYPSAKIDRAWRQLLFCQHHDGVTGCGSDIVLLDLLDHYREALECATEARRSALTALSQRIDTRSEGKNKPVLLFNSLPWRRKGVVRHTITINDDETFEPFELFGPNGELIPYEVEPVSYKKDGTLSKLTARWVEHDLPAAGYHLNVKKPDVKMDIPFVMEAQSRTWIENEFFRVEVNPERGGGIVSLVEKETGREYINTDHKQPANDLMLLEEGPGDEPAWRLLTTGQRLAASAESAQVRTAEGPITTRLIARGSGPGPCGRVQEIRLYKGLPFIDCVTILEDYKGYGKQVLEADPEQSRDLYVTAFPLNLPGAIPVYEDRFYAKAYRRSRGYMDFKSSFLEWDSGHAMNSCHRWIDISWTFLVRFTSEKNETASLAVGPSEIVISNDNRRALRDRLMKHLARHGVTSTPRYDTDKPKSDWLFRQCSFCIGTIEENTYTKRLLERNPEAREYYKRNMDEIGFVCLAVEDRGGGRNTPVFIFAGNTEALTEQAVDELIQGTIAHQWECHASACFIKQLGKVEKAGFAVFNRGSTLCSLEKDGTLALALMHTSPYASPQTSWPFDFAEQKTHIFQYRLYPHTGDWRQAEITRRAMEYNLEPYALSTTSHEGILQNRQSFWSVEPSNILVSAIKPVGFPEASFQNGAEIDGQSAIVRLYEAHGEDSNIWLESNREVKSIKPVRLHEGPLPHKKEVIREDQFIRTVARANEIVTLQFEFKSAAEKIPPLPQTEPAPPVLVPARYWRYNTGAAPEGFFPVALSLRGHIRTHSYLADASIHHLDLVIVNNSPRQEREGVVEIITPSFWRAVPSRVSYRLQGGAFQIIPLHILFEGPEREGFVKVRTTVNGVIIEDILHLGREPEFDISMRLTNEAFSIILRHEYPYPIEGFLNLILPIESWPDSLVGEYSLASINPGKREFDIPPEEEVVLDFPVFDPQSIYGVASDRFWLGIKIAVHHCIHYFHVRMDGRRSEGLGRVIHPPYDFFDKKPE